MTSLIDDNTLVSALDIFLMVSIGIFFLPMSAIQGSGSNGLLSSMNEAQRTVINAR